MLRCGVVWCAVCICVCVCVWRSESERRCGMCDAEIAPMNFLHE
jgi:hypothetical protein